ncbi:peptide deformylase [Pelagicoccus sp. SDUM812005]|uniref:peptide deformylase n=1 Tax=Pelagicoccus sp. SDUM812005 TaxID=3041257 RepID=UPI00280CFA7B|nr:peptide deformylase [Pelagicoccus sp. SDUM812005]MDQ8182358.1 peptide deformylase [Pelagicoccus sp. SDUM812005]
MLLQIVQYGDKVLHQAGEPITEFDEELRTLFQDMVDTMYEAEGIGLAAQQVGLAKQFCVVDLTGCDPDFEYTLDGGKPPLDLFMPIGMCNPKVEIIKSEPLVYEEGCLSFPNIRGDVERIESIRCEYQDIEGNPHVIEADGLLGRCIQHEVDHLNGILFTDRMKKKVLKKIQLPVNALKAKTLQRLKRRGA